jgi:hypothetical protein
VSDPLTDRGAVTNQQPDARIEPDPTSQGVIRIFGREDEGDDAEGSAKDRAWFAPRRASEIKYTVGDVDAGKLQRKLADLLTKLDAVLKETPGKVGAFSVESMSITVEVSAKGSVSLLGTGGETGASGGITFQLKRQ